MSPASAIYLAAAWLAASAPTFVSETRQVRLDVVASCDGVPISGLQAEDFEILDDGARQHLSLVANDVSSVHAVLVLDQSESVGSADRKVLKDAAAAFLGTLGTRDRATLLAFTHELTLVSGPDGPDVVRRSLAELDGTGTTALYDAIHTGLILGGAAPGRPFVIVFTDGIDRVSWITAPQLWQAARRAEATLYFVSTVPWSEEEPTLVTPAAAADAQGPPFLRVLADETGGRVWTGSGHATEDQFSRVLAEVKSRYLLTYEPANPTPGWHNIEVRLARRQGEIRTRRGYFMGR